MIDELSQPVVLRNGASLIGLRSDPCNAGLFTVNLVREETSLVEISVLSVTFHELTHCS